MIINPILKGFNPDPSICRVGNDYYIATSTFEWFPGVQIHHSRDLANWTLITHPLNQTDWLDMRGHPNSCGIWAPCLSYSDGVFYLVYTDVRDYQTDYQSRKNYLITSRDIMGPWSDPIFLNSSGFDPSLFHDNDGRKWLLNVLWDHRPEPSINHHRAAKFFSGIIAQEFDSKKEGLVGPIHNIFEGSELGLVEGSHLYRINGYYYLLTAEGGTFSHHASLFARSKNLLGPYEIDPQMHFLTSAGHHTNELQRAGHGDLVTLPNGDHYFVHLASRPLPNRGRSVLGRETAIQKVSFSDSGWPRLSHGQKNPLLETHNSLGFDSTLEFQKEHFDFSTDKLTIHYQSPRFPLLEPILSYSARPGYLRLKGQEPPTSLYEQSLIARRQQAFCFTAETTLDFNPKSFQQMAGLMSFYNTQKFIYLCLTHDESLGRVIEIVMATMEGKMLYPLGQRIPLPKGQIRLKIQVEWDQWRGFWATESGNWNSLGGYIDYSGLADEVGAEHFTGAFVGMACHDLSGQFINADFQSFSYNEYNSNQ
ncbi:glycoside hydrolase family 43 protein [Gilvimarinus chinensis]|uniref:glycoside hydrolase family 43 protein n=1 Tax=Gilvimarinus chinensis TaxID=396005 RepID=UPI000370F231|nr:glycoside hydrolase family 43 protein [Gilvimarinus chinensis]